MSTDLPRRTTFSQRVRNAADTLSTHISTLSRRVKSHFMQPPPKPLRRELLLTLTTFQTGILDAATFVTYGLFVGNMTGNVIFLGLAISGLYYQDIFPSIIALASFFLGAWITGLYDRSTHQKEKGYTRVFYVLFTIFHLTVYLIAAALVYTSTIPQRTPSNTRLILFFLLAMGQGSQIVVSKKAGLPEFTTNVITSTMADLSADFDPVHLQKGWRSRVRRVASIVSLLIGAIVGGEVFGREGFGVTLFIAGGISGVLALGWGL